MGICHACFLWGCFATDLIRRRTWPTPLKVWSKRPTLLKVWSKRPPWERAGHSWSPFFYRCKDFLNCLSLTHSFSSHISGCSLHGQSSFTLHFVLCTFGHGSSDCMCLILSSIRLSWAHWRLKVQYSVVLSGLTHAHSLSWMQDLPWTLGHVRLWIVLPGVLKLPLAGPHVPWEVQINVLLCLLTHAQSVCWTHGLSRTSEQCFWCPRFPWWSAAGLHSLGTNEIANAIIKAYLPAIIKVESNVFTAVNFLPKYLAWKCCTEKFLLRFFCLCPLPSPCLRLFPTDSELLVTAALTTLQISSTERGQVWQLSIEIGFYGFLLGLSLGDSTPLILPSLRPLIQIYVDIPVNPK